MQKEIFVNVDLRETRVAVVESGCLVELHMEREDRVVGSIYKAKVSNVLPGMDAAFVDIGLDKNAFLYVGDILSDESSLPVAIDDKAKARPTRRRTDPNARIRDLVKPGQDILVQVVKAPRGTKGARVSTRVSIAGRYLVFMPDAGNIGISRKIEDTRERDRLKKIGEKIRTEGGIIIRTEAENRSEADIRDDYDYLLRTWRAILDRADNAPPATIIHQELGLLFRVIRDMLSSDVYAVVIDDKSDYHKALELAQSMSPRLAEKVQHYSEPTPIFDAFGIEKEIDRLLKPKVWLKSGGYLLMDETEALTSIDVNTGKFVGSTSLNETILKTNLEAVNEIVRQLRFRDLGGMIVLDFIDMASMSDRQLVMRALDTALKDDRTRTKVASISPLGLIEMTRKRTGENLTEFLRDKCPYCEGRATIQATLTTAVTVDRAVREKATRDASEAFLVALHPDVAVEFVGHNGRAVDKLERETGKAIYVRPDATMHREKFAIAPADVPSMLRLAKGLKPAKVMDLAITAHGSGDDLRPIAWHNGMLVEVTNGAAHTGQTHSAKLLKVSRSYMIAELVGVPPVSVSLQNEPSVTEEYTKRVFKEERELVSNTTLEREFSSDTRGRDRRHRRERTRDGEKPETRETETAVAVPAPEIVPAEVPETAAQQGERESNRRRRRRRGRKDDKDIGPAVQVALGEIELEEQALGITVLPPHVPVNVPVTLHDDAEEEHAIGITFGPPRPRRKWQWRKRRKNESADGNA